MAKRQRTVRMKDGAIVPWVAGQAHPEFLESLKAGRQIVDTGVALLLCLGQRKTWRRGKGIWWNSVLHATGDNRILGIHHQVSKQNSPLEPDSQTGMQEIIRHDNHADRGIPPNRVTVEQVTAAAKQIGQDADFSTHDIAKILGVDEYKVRGAIGWLLKRGQITEVGERVFRSQRLRKLYRAKLYRLKAEPKQVDFGTLMNVFCR